MVGNGISEPSTVALKSCGFGCKVFHPFIWERVNTPENGGFLGDDPASFLGPCSNFSGLFTVSFWGGRVSLLNS